MYLSRDALASLNICIPIRLEDTLGLVSQERTTSRLRWHKFDGLEAFRCYVLRRIAYARLTAKFAEPSSKFLKLFSP